MKLLLELFPRLAGQLGWRYPGRIPVVRETHKLWENCKGSRNENSTSPESFRGQKGDSS